MFPTCSNSSWRAGRLYRLRIGPSTSLLSPPHAAPGNGHPDETFTRHQFMSAPIGPHLRLDLPLPASGLSEVLALDRVPLVGGGVGRHLLEPRARPPLALAAALRDRAGAVQALDQVVAESARARPCSERGPSGEAEGGWARPAAGCRRGRRRAAPPDGQSGGEARADPPAHRSRSRELWSPASRARRRAHPSRRWPCRSHGPGRADRRRSRGPRQRPRPRGVPGPGSAGASSATNVPRPWREAIRPSSIRRR